MDHTRAGSAYQRALQHLDERQYHWAITGVAGFIGSHLLELLLKHGQRVSGIDNFLTGHHSNLEQVRQLVSPDAWKNFRFVEGDVRSLPRCAALCDGADFVLHQAALGSVPRSIDNPLLTSDINIMGFLNMLTAARDKRVRRVVYAASSAAYGDHPGLPKVEAQIGRALSPYAVSKVTNELYADVFARCYALPSIGLRYFNVFGPRQDPRGAYAAVIPQWFTAMVNGQALTIHGDGSSSRDFCYVANVVQANILACLCDDDAALNQVYNVAVNVRTSLDTLFRSMHSILLDSHPHLAGYQPHYDAFRPGDVMHSLADISKACRLLGYAPSHRLEQGLKEAAPWYVANALPVASPIL